MTVVFVWLAVLALLATPAGFFQCCCGPSTPGCPCTTTPDVLNASITGYAVCLFGATFSGTLTYSATVPADISGFTRGAGWFSALTTCPNGNQYRWCLVCQPCGPGNLDKCFDLYSFSPTTGEVHHAGWSNAGGVTYCPPLLLNKANSTFYAVPASVTTITP